MYEYIFRFLCYFISETFVKSLKEYEIALPVRVTGSGDFLSHNLHPHHQIHKRSSERTDSFIHYKVNVKNKDIHISVLPNDKLYYPSFVIERRSNSSGNISDSKFERYSDKNRRRCHFIGEVRGETNLKLPWKHAMGW